MEYELTLLGEKIIEKKLEMARKVHNIRMAEASDDLKQRLARVEEEQIIRARTQLIALFGEALKRDSNMERVHKDMEKWGKTTGEFSYSLGIPLDEAMKDTSYYRRLLSEVIEEEMTIRNMSVAEVFQVMRIIDPLLDHAVYCFSLTYVDMNKKALEAAKTAFLELSVPVVPLSDAVAVLPLVGDIDTERARLIMQETLKSAVELKLSSLILDLSGVIVVDTMVADQLFKVISALELIGVSTILTGIRPEIAQTIVSLGINFDNVMMKVNLKQALTDLVFQQAN